jgi:hypothetical protein
MVTITRNVSDIPATDLPALEHLIGAPLRPSQKVRVQVLEADSVQSQVASDATEPQLPDWCNVYEGLSDKDIAQLEKQFQRLQLRRDHS